MSASDGFVYFTSWLSCIGAAFSCFHLFFAQNNPPFEVDAFHLTFSDASPFLCALCVAFQSQFLDEGKPDGMSGSPTGFGDGGVQASANPRGRSRFAV